MSGEESLSASEASLPASGSLDTGSGMCLWACGRCFSVLTHFVTLGSELAALFLFAVTDNLYFAGIIAAALLFTGTFYTYAAWGIQRPEICSSGCLPMRRLSPWALCCCGAPLAVICGYLQCLVVPLAFNHRRRKQTESLVADTEDAGTGFGSLQCKAVNAIFEGIVCSGVIFLAYLGIDFPSTGGNEEAVTHGTDGDASLAFLMRQALRILGLISFASAGLGIMELDTSISSHLSVRDSNGRKRRKPILHWLFRTCEIICRVSLHVVFILATVTRFKFWWIPALSSVLLSWMTVFQFGGQERSMFVRPLCSIPATFVDIFRFVDSQYKRGAAQRVSNLLFWRHWLESLILPAIAYYVVGGETLKTDVSTLCHKNPASVIIMAATTILYPILYYCTAISAEEEQKNLFVQCGRHNVAAVNSIMASVGQVFDFNRADTDGMTPLMRAIQSGNYGMFGDDEDVATICEVLINNGARIEVSLQSGRAAALEDCCARIWKSSSSGWTALHFAARRGSTLVLGKLLPAIPSAQTRAINPDWFRDRRGDTPMHIAARYGNTDFARKLTTIRPDWKDARNLRGQTPRDSTIFSATRAALDEPTSSSAASRPLLEPSPLFPPRRRGPEEIPVRRVVVEECIAPGLCSYVASNAGGPICSVFLAPASFDAAQAHGAGAINQDPESQSLTSAGASMDMERLQPVSKNNEFSTFPAWEQMRKKADVNLAKAFSAGVRNKAADAILGRGAYGVVWLARHERSGQLYAVKNISTLVPNRAAVAQRECDMCDRVRIYPHPCVVALYLVEQFVEASLTVLVMEYCPNGDVLQAVSKAKAGERYCPPKQTMSWLGQIFLGLEHVHLKMGTLLRDLKPDNVVLDRQNRAKLTDFGLGRFGADSPGTWTFGAPPGSPGYVSPEIIRQQPYDAKADLYSYGVLVWLVLTGGLLGRATPLPPMGTMYGLKGFQAHADDFQLLKNGIDDPGKWSCSPLQPESAKTLVLSLIQRDPGLRPDHAQIRDSDFFQTMPAQLPSHEAPTEEVVHWLEQQGY